ncbi:MAG TPA: tetratricopeptide repeat protein [Thermoanaerobaculia bacterium]|nr:tetratricopeptide repeat protein [Thermoanaerobaculia bacterium]
MNQQQSAAALASSFKVTCPGCGQRLRFAVGPEAAGPDAAPRLRVQCASCRATFSVRRPGAEPGAATTDGTMAAPPYVGVPVAPASTGSDRSVGSSGAASTALLSAAEAAPSLRRASRDAPGFVPGDLVADRYRVVRFIARGGMGEVYEADDLELRERVALKTVRAEVSRDDLVIERFKREIQLARKVTHPNVCRIFDVSHHREPREPDGAAIIFLTMELLTGETLAQRIRDRGPMTPDEALPAASQIAEALHAAHQAGVIHRDLKPGNVVLVESRSGLRAVVTDFGLARLEAGPEQGLTLTGTGVVGTPAYLAPEQIEGSEISPAVDIYALGIVLYEMLTGTVPFLADTALATAVKRLREAPVSPRVHRPGLDPRWEAAILRCLERDPAARFADALQVVHALTGPARPMPLQPIPGPAPAAPAVEPSRAQPTTSRRRLQLLILTGLTLLVAGVGYVRYTGWKEAQIAPRPGLLLPAAVTVRPSVAVLGFKDLSGNAETSWLSPALAEMLSTELAAGGDLRVIAGDNVARAKVEMGLADVGQLERPALARLRTLLGSEAVVLGSYLVLDGASGPQVRLDLLLQDAATGETTARLSESGPQSGLFTLVAKTGQRLRQALGAADPGSPENAKPALPSHPEAARLYAEGLSKLRGFDPVGARDLLARAAVLEPGNAMVHSALATAWGSLGYDNKAREEAKTAFDRSAGLPREERLLIQGRYREAVQDWNKAAEIYWQLWSMYPDNLDHGLRLAGTQTAAGRVEEALATVDALRTLPAPFRDDPRIDLAEATAAGARADFQRQREAAARATRKGKEQEAPLMAAQALLLECRALRNLGQSDKAFAACEEGRALHARLGDRSGVAEALLHAANVRFDRGDLASALRLSEEALVTYREIGNRAAEAGALNNVAVILKSQGDLDRARELYEQVLAITREIGSRGGEAYALNNLAGVLLRRGDLERAGALFEESLGIRREQGDRSGEAYALDNIGVVLRKRGDLNGARRRHEEALRIRRQTRQKISEVTSLNNLAMVLLDQGELEAARDRLRTSLALGREIGNPSAQAGALFGLGEVLAAEGRLAEARKHHETALEHRHRLGEKGMEAESRLALALVLLQWGEAGAAAGLTTAAAGAFSHQGAIDGEALALSVSALALNTRGDAAGAGQALDRAAVLVARNQDLRTRLIVQLRAARLGRAPEGQSAETALRQVSEQATRAGFPALRLEADVLLARQTRDAARLTTLEQEATAMGYGLLAREAADGLR